VVLFPFGKGTFGLITWVNSKTWLSLLNNNLTNLKQLLDSPPHKASPLQPNRTLASYVDVYSPLLYTPNPPPLLQVVRIATTTQEKLKPWKETFRSSKITMSYTRGLAATPCRLPVKAACIYVSFPHFDYCKDYVDVSDI
jgi:hypothetical protein